MSVSPTGSGGMAAVSAALATQVHALAETLATTDVVLALLLESLGIGATLDVSA